MGIDTSSLFFVDNCQIIDAAVRNHFGTQQAKIFIFMAQLIKKATLNSCFICVRNKLFIFYRSHLIAWCKI
jgi:hypothetical protein